MESEKKLILSALLRAKRKFGPVLKTAKGNYGKYPKLEQVFEAIDPSLEEEGIFLCQTERDGFLVTQAWHAESGQVLEGQTPLVFEKNTPQGAGSALTYSRRYCLLAFLGLAAEDDDGQDAENTHKGKATKPPEKTLEKPNGKPLPAKPVTPEVKAALEFVVNAGKVLKGKKLGDIPRDQRIAAQLHLAEAKPEDLSPEEKECLKMMRILDPLA